MQISKENGSCIISNDTFQIVIDDNYTPEGFDIPDIIVQPTQGKVDITMVTTLADTAKKISEIVTFLESWKPEIIIKTTKNVYDLITNHCQDWLLEEQAKTIQGDDIEKESESINTIQELYDTQRLVVQSLKQKIKHVQLQCSFYEQKIKKGNQLDSGFSLQQTQLFEEFKKQHELFNQITQRIIQQEGIIKKIGDQQDTVRRKLNRYNKMCLDRVSGTANQKNKANNFIKKFEQQTNYGDLSIILEGLKNDYYKQSDTLKKLKQDYETIHHQYINAQIEYVFNDNGCIDMQQQLYVNDNQILDLYEKINEQSQEELEGVLNELLIFENASTLAKHIKILNKKSMHIIGRIKCINEQEKLHDFEKEIQIVQLNQQRQLIQQTLYGRGNFNGKGLYQDLNDLLLYNNHTSGIIYFKEVQHYQDMINDGSWRTASKETNAFLRKGLEKLKHKKLHEYKNEVTKVRDKIKKIIGYKKEIEQLQKTNDSIISSAVNNLIPHKSDDIVDDIVVLQQSLKQLSDQKESLKKQLNSEMELLQGLEWNILDEKKSFAHTIVVYLRKKKEFEIKLNTYEMQSKQIIIDQATITKDILEKKQKWQQEKDQMAFKNDQKEHESDEDYAERKHATLTELQSTIHQNEKLRALNKKELKNIRKKGRGIFSLYTLFFSQVREWKQALTKGVSDQEINDLFSEIDTEGCTYAYLETSELRKRKKTGLPPMVRKGMAGGHRSDKDYDNKVSTGLRKK